LGRGNLHRVIDIAGSDIQSAAGKASMLLFWLTKFDLSLPTTLAPTALASSGMISGTGLAIAKIRLILTRQGFHPLD
jgi:hypothetical protein